MTDHNECKSKHSNKEGRKQINLCMTDGPRACGIAGQGGCPHEKLDRNCCGQEAWGPGRFGAQLHEQRRGKVCFNGYIIPVQHDVSL